MIYAIMYMTKIYIIAFVFLTIKTQKLYTILFKKELTVKKILPVNLKVDVTLYPHHSLPLCIPFINENTKSWYMNNFINVFYRYEYPTVYDYTDYKNFYTGVMDVDTFTVSTALNFISEKCFKEFLNDDKYIYAWADQYYIPATQFYENEHNIHPILIYGYDADDKIYFCKCFSVTKSVYDAKIKFSDYEKAVFEAAKIKGCYNQDEFFRLFKIREDAKFDFMLNSFADEIYNYATGKGTYKDSYYYRNDLPLELENVYHYEVYNISAYGIEVTKLFYDALSGINIRCFDYRLLHMVCENKKLISDRLQYVAENCKCTDLFKNLTDEYSKIAAEYDQLRYLAMKLAFAENKDFYTLKYNDKNKDRLCGKILDLYTREKELLHKIIFELIRTQVNQSFPQYKTVNFNRENLQFSADFENSERVNSIVLCSYSKRFGGKLYIDGDIKEIGLISTKNFYVIELNKPVSVCKFVPDDRMAADLFIEVFAVCEHVLKCGYLASSTYPSESHRIDPKNLAEYDISFWCSEIEDSNPWVEVIFDRPVIVNTLLAEQFISEKRVSEATLQVYTDNEWKNITRFDGAHGKQIIKIGFPEVTSDRFRLQINKTVASENGYSMPNLMLLKIFRE